VRLLIGQHALDSVLENKERTFLGGDLHVVSVQSIQCKLVNNYNLKIT